MALFVKCEPKEPKYSKESKDSKTKFQQTHFMVESKEIICHSVVLFLIWQETKSKQNDNGTVTWEVPHILMVRDRHSKTWGCPAGHVEPNETPMESMKREFQEEVGGPLPLQINHFLQFAILRPEQNKHTGIYVAFIDDHTAQHISTEWPKTFEIDKAAWIPMQTLTASLYMQTCAKTITPLKWYDYPFAFQLRKAALFSCWNVLVALGYWNAQTCHDPKMFIHD